MRKSIVAAALVGSVAVALTGCGSSSTTSSSGTLPTVKLMVGGIDKQIYLPYKLADELGFYKKHGVTVELSTESDAVGAEDAMVSGQVDMAGAWYNHAIQLQAKGKDIVDIVQLSGAPGEREMCATGENVHSGADFAGKKLGVTDLGSGTDSLTKFLAAAKGVDAASLSRVAVGAGATAIAAIQNKKIDCVMTTQPTVVTLENKNLAYSAVDLASTKGAQDALGGAFPAASVLVHNSWLQGHQKEAQAVVDALVETMHWIHDHSAQEIADKLPAEYTSSAAFTKDDYVKALDGDKGQFLVDGRMPANGPETVQKMLLLIKGIDAPLPDLSVTYTNKYADQAAKDLGTS